MIGSATLLRLMEDGAYDITLVSRGTWPFDTASLIQPHVNTIVCDRENPLTSCSDLMEVIHSTDEFYAVLDFSGFEPDWVQDAVDTLKNKVRVYIYMSTDSVYEVSEGVQEDIELNRLGKLTQKLDESQAIRPRDAHVRQKLNEADSYGNEKLAGEEVLQQYATFPYVSLRFSDVLGPRDGTERLILYHIWIKYSQAIGIPLTVPNEVENITTSITYVEDAVSSILAAVKTEESWNEAYNVACEETFNVVQGIQSIAAVFGIGDVEVKAVPTEESFEVFPSVRRGPMDITRAKRVLKFKPTPLEEVLKKTVEWHEQVFAEDELVREHMLEEFIFDVIDEEYDEGAIERLLNAVGDELGVAYDFDPDAEYDGSDL